MSFFRRVPAWVWFFLALGLLGIGAVAAPLWFNLSQQLRPEDVERARELWEHKRPADYEVEYTLQGLAPEHFTVRVRGGRVVAVADDNGPLAPGTYLFDDMDTLFRFIETDLANDRRPDSPRTFTVAGFSPEDGHVLHYVHSVLRTRARSEIDVKLHPAAAR
jgi:hypothetical protein